MGKKFYVTIICLLTCSVVLLGLSYSKQSTDNNDNNIIETNDEKYRVIYSHNEYLSTTKNNELKITLINKQNDDKDYALYLNEIDNDVYEDVSYTTDGTNYYTLTDNMINLGTLSAYGTTGDAKIYTIKLKSNNNYVFEYFIAENVSSNEVSYDS